MIAAPPVNEDNGVRKPQNWTTGITVRMAVPKRAASCVLVKAEMSSPIPVVPTT